MAQVAIARNVRIKYSLTLEGKQTCIRVIILRKNRCMWVGADGDKDLTLINNNGDVIKKSVPVGDTKIHDAKAYDKEILISDKSNIITRMPRDGTTISTFSDLAPYEVWGLGVTDNLEVFACLYDSTRKEHKVVKIESRGKITQTIQYGTSGALHYKWPFSVTGLPTGGVTVVDWGAPKQVICVDSDGKHVFTWTGEAIGRGQNEKFDPWFITHDSDYIFVTEMHNSKIYAIKRDGTGAKCLIDRTMGICDPMAIEIDYIKGQLLVGCADGKIHVIEY